MLMLPAKTGVIYERLIGGGYLELPSTRKGLLKELARANGNMLGNNPRTYLPCGGIVICLPDCTDKLRTQV
jgi:hypothetical protein